MGAGQVGAVQGGPNQWPAVEVGAGQVGVVQVGVAQSDGHQVGAGQVGVFQVGAGQVGSKRLVSFEPILSEELRSALIRLASWRFASEKSAPLRSSPTRFWFCRSSPRNGRANTPGCEESCLTNRRFSSRVACLAEASLIEFCKKIDVTPRKPPTRSATKIFWNHHGGVLNHVLSRWNRLGLRACAHSGSPGGVSVVTDTSLLMRA